MFLLLDAPNLGGAEKAKLMSAWIPPMFSTAGPFVRSSSSGSPGTSGRRTVSRSKAAQQPSTSPCPRGCGTGGRGHRARPFFCRFGQPHPVHRATPVLVDVDPGTWTLDPGLAEAAVTPRTRAILPVHLYGNLCDMDNLGRIAEERGLVIIEDATESLGGTWNGKPSGTLGNFGCFSFNGNKLITTGGGGMVVARNRGRMNHIRFLVNQARDASKGYFHPEMGYNYRMTNLEPPSASPRWSTSSFFWKERSPLPGYTVKSSAVSRRWNSRKSSLGR